MMREAEAFLNRLRREGSLSEADLKREASALRSTTVDRHEVQHAGQSFVQRGTFPIWEPKDAYEYDSPSSWEYSPGITLSWDPAVPEPWVGAIAAQTIQSVMGGSADPRLTLPPHYTQALSGDFDEEMERVRVERDDQSEDLREPHCATCGRLMQSWGPMQPDHEESCGTCDLDFEYEATSYGDQEDGRADWRRRYRAAKERRLELRRAEVGDAD